MTGFRLVTVPLSHSIKCEGQSYPLELFGHLMDSVVSLTLGFPKDYPQTPLVKSLQARGRTGFGELHMSLTGQDLVASLRRGFLSAIELPIQDQNEVYFLHNIAFFYRERDFQGLATSEERAAFKGLGPLVLKTTLDLVQAAGPPDTNTWLVLEASGADLEPEVNPPDVKENEQMQALWEMYNYHPVGLMELCDIKEYNARLRSPVEYIDIGRYLGAVKRNFQLVKHYERAYGLTAASFGSAMSVFMYGRLQHVYASLMGSAGFSAWGQ